ncbi:MAG: sigma-54-dependent Fis family transcriptional regulator [Rhodocyclales bacterium]|nr:sigma-54-dependent Fis family transcriptional regulator [Rhodocyclales bacterium]
MTPMPRDAGAALRHARHQLLDSGELPSGFAHATVARSWQRCFRAGLAPVGRLPEVPHLSACQLARAAEQQRELIAHARPVMEYLHAQMHDSGSMVILADDRGVLLQALGDTDFLGRAERVALMPGASWAERYRGTNAIGTALAESAAVTVHAGEHYLERNGFLTCAAAPVTAPNGRLLGVLDISGDQRGRHPHTFGLVQAAAQMIENRLFDTSHGASLRVRFHTMAEGIGTVAEGILAFSEDGWIVGANRTGLQLLGLASADLGATPLDRVFDLDLPRLFDWGRRSPLQPMLVNSLRGKRFFLRVELGQRPVSAPARKQKPGDALAAIDTGDERLAAAIARARKVLGKTIPLLLQGESGAGKEVFARAVHESGPRRAAPFVAVNCAALPENLIESELFGYVPGAFTGARREGCTGRIREAQGGTLFLDEIGDMPLALQARLLRVLQEKQVTPLGGGKAIPVDFTLVCATHRNLKVEMESGRFRTDLYYRINGMALTLPALRERSDFSMLLTRLLDELSGRRDVALEPSLAQAFAEYSWPGNLRQLANALRTACALLDEGESLVGWQHLPDDLKDDLLAPPPRDIDGEVPDNLRAQSDAAIQRVVAVSSGNLSEAARRLGVSRSTLYRRLRRTAMADFSKRTR